MIRHRQILGLALPYTLSMATSFLIQAIDSAMVAPLGKTALAALTVAAAAAFLPNAFTMGLITSVQKRTAAAPQDAHSALSAGLLLSVVLALPFSITFFFFSESIARLYTSGDSVILAASYLKIFSGSFIFAAANQAMNGYWIGTLNAKTRLWITLAMTGLNAAGNWILIPRWGFNGAAIASLIAIVLGFLLNLLLTVQWGGFRWRTPSRADIRKDLLTIFGVSLHQMSLALTLNAAVFLVGLIGLNALAVANVFGMLSLPILYVGIGYGTATGSFLVQALRDRASQAARRIAHRALAQVLMISLVGALILNLFSEPIRRWFFRDPETFALSFWPFVCLGVLYLIDGVCCALQRFHFLTNGLRASFLLMTGVQWLMFIPTAWAGVHFFHINYPQYLVLHLIQRALIGALLYWAWLQRSGTPPALS